MMGNKSKRKDEVSAVIRRLIARAGSANKAADAFAAAGGSRRTFWNVKSGGTKPREATIKALADALKGGE